MHVMMVVMMVMMVVVVMMMHRSGRSRGGGGGGGGFLRDGVAGEGDGESGGGDKSLDHGNLSFRKRPQRSSRCKLPGPA
jgi:hypothetical protein